MQLQTTSIGLAGVILTALSACGLPVEETWQERRARMMLEDGAVAIEHCRQTQCSDLDLSGTTLADYSVLNDMPHVTRLRINGPDFTNVGDIAEMTQLTALHLEAFLATDFAPVAGLVNLTDLTIEGNPHDFRVNLSGLTQLRSLTLRGFDVVDIGFVANMPQLAAFNLWADEVVSLAQLSGHPNLSSMDLSLMSVPPDLTVFYEMPALRDLYVGGMMIIEMEARGESAFWAPLEERGVAIEFGRGSITPEIIEPASE